MLWLSSETRNEGQQSTEPLALKYLGKGMSEAFVLQFHVGLLGLDWIEIALQEELAANAEYHNMYAVGTGMSSLSMC